MSANATSTRSRRPAGTPTGGQFAPETHAEPEVSLGGFQSADELLRAARQSVEFWMRSRSTTVRPDISIDDVVQNTALRYLEAAQREVRNPGGLLHRVAQREAVRGTSLVSDSAQRAGLDEVRRRMRDGNRGPGGWDDVVAEVKADGWKVPADHRRFSHGQSGASVSLGDGDAYPRTDRALTVPSVEDELERPDSTVEPGSRFAAISVALQERAEMHSQTGSQIAMGEIRGSLWSALSDRSGVHVGLGHVPTQTASRARQAVERAGGVVAVATAWSESGGADTQGAASALFRPFAVRTVEDRRAVVSVLMQHPDYADEVWGAALFGASHPERRVSGAA